MAFFRISRMSQFSRPRGQSKIYEKYDSLAWLDGSLPCFVPRLWPNVNETNRQHVRFERRNSSGSRNEPVALRLCTMAAVHA